MCNACGFLCCGSDEFDGCGCDSCPEPACRSNDPDEDEPYDDEYERHSACAWCDGGLSPPDRKAREAFCPPCRGTLGVFVCQRVAGETT